MSGEVHVTSSKGTRAHHAWVSEIIKRRKKTAKADGDEAEDGDEDESEETAASSGAAPWSIGGGIVKNMNLRPTSVKMFAADILRAAGLVTVQMLGGVAATKLADGFSERRARTKAKAADAEAPLKPPPFKRPDDPPPWEQRPKWETKWEERNVL